MTPTQSYVSQVSDVRVNGVTCDIHLWGFKRVAQIDYVEFAPVSDHATDLHTRNRMTESMAAILERIPSDDPQNLLKVSRYEVRSLIAPYYEAWLSQNGYAPGRSTQGLHPLSQLPGMTEHHAQLIQQAMRIYHIEELADSKDESLQRGALSFDLMRDYRHRAQRWLTTARRSDDGGHGETAETVAMREALEARDMQLAEQAETLAKMQAQLAQLTSMMDNQKKGRRNGQPEEAAA